MTLLARRREELRGPRNSAEPAASVRAVVVRPPQPRPSFLHVQSAIGNHAVGSWLRASAASSDRRDEPAMGSRRRGGDARDVVASELRPMLRLAGLPSEPQQSVRALSSLLVPDGAAPADGQMTRSAFLAAVRDAARAAAERGLAGSGHTARDCPWIEHYVRYYEQQSAARIEADLRRYLPAASAATTADELLVLAAEHVGASVRHWAQSGELVGVPRNLPGAGLVASVQAQLGRGRPLPASARGRMERAFGARFADVRLHTDAVASRLARRLRTRAFAVGPHVAFDRGEYRPGSVVGDAVLAHELAHTLQQRGAEPASPSAATSTPRVENAADSAAASVLARLWGGGGAFARRFARQPVPRLHSGLALASCQEIFSEPELRRYLDHLQSHGPEKGIEDDNRARDVVRKNRARPGTFVPTDKQTLGMIEDMLDGDTGEDDQNAIFELLDQSKAPRLQFLFTNGLTSTRLRKKFSGDRKQKLEAFFEKRFDKGAKNLDANIVVAIPDADLVEYPLDYRQLDPDRGFRSEDFLKLQKQGKKLTFSGSLSPLPDDAQRILLGNLSATISFVLDPNNPIRVAELQAVRQLLAADPKSPLFRSRDFATPAERLDATDFYHGHVCVPKKVFKSRQRLQELQKEALAYHGKGADLDVNDTVEDDIREAQGGPTTTQVPTTRYQAGKIKAVVDKHRVPFLQVMGKILEALQTVPEAGVLYHTLENVKPWIGGKQLDTKHPVVNVFTPLATGRPTFERPGTPDCEQLINFSFQVTRSGEITLLPGAESEMVRAYEILNAPPGGKP